MFCVHIFFKPLGYIPRTARLFGNSVFNFFDMKLFPKQLYYFILPPATEESWNVPKSLPTCVTAHLFDYSHPSGFEAIAQYAFANDILCPFRYLIFVSKVFLQIFCSFLN